MKAVIQTGGKQYIVAKGDELTVELLDDKKTTTFDALMVIDDAKVKVGTPTVAKAKVTAKVIGDERGKKVTSIRYKSKKRVHKVRGHRQGSTRVEITGITTA